MVSLVLQSMVDLEDEILIPAPRLPTVDGPGDPVRGRAIHYLCDEPNGWAPDPADIESRITEPTKAIILINPNNPTGAVHSEKVLRQIAEIAHRHGLIVLSDEIYDKIVYQGAHRHMAEFTSPDVLCFTFSGLSKAYRSCGFRAGWVSVTGPMEDTSNLLEGLLLANMRMCANVPAQHAIQIALGGHQSIDELVAPGGRFHDPMVLAHQMLNQIEGGVLHLRGGSAPSLSPPRSGGLRDHR